MLDDNQRRVLNKFLQAALDDYKKELAEVQAEHIASVNAIGSGDHSVEAQLSHLRAAMTKLAAGFIYYQTQASVLLAALGLGVEGRDTGPSLQLIPGGRDGDDAPGDPS